MNAEVTIYVITYNEELMLPFFIKHYRSRFPDCKIVVCDNYSTDRTVAIAHEHNCTVTYYYTNNKIDEECYLNIKNDIWRYNPGVWRGDHTCQTEWCLVVDCDELIDIRPQTLSEDINIIQATGYDMYGEDGIPETVDSGVPNQDFSKIVCWKPEEIDAVNYYPGAHRAEPAAMFGVTLKFNKYEVPLYHYKYIGLEYISKRHKLFAERLSEKNKKLGWSLHYNDPCEPYYEYLKANKVKLL